MNREAALVKTILDKPLNFEWSVQGLGMLRTYLAGGKQFRLHIWNSALMIKDVSPMHNHPWHLDSYIVCGTLINQRFTSPGTGGIERWLKPKEFNQVEITCGENACSHGEVTKVMLNPRPPEYYYAGDDYQQFANEIHRTSYTDGTVTIVDRAVPPGRSADRALVLWEGNGGWVDAAPRPATEREIIDTVWKAQKQMEAL